MIDLQEVEEYHNNLLINSAEAKASEILQV